MNRRRAPANHLGLTRRGFVGLSLGLASCQGGSRFPGQLMGASHHVGHILRDGRPPLPSSFDPADVIVAGSGMAGLIAALRLKQAGRRVIILDLEAQLGGNASSGENAVSAYPWGAHYIPIPEPHIADTYALLHELGVLQDGKALDHFVCADPEDRLFFRGEWHEGLLPQRGLSPDESSEITRFLALIAKLRDEKGADGKRVFTLPLDESSADPEWRALDKLTMHQWLEREGFRTEVLRWHVDYCCRDDYGAGIKYVSAWAGLHYFASRHSDGVVTWPEGNGWLVKRLIRELTNGENPATLLPSHLVTQLTPEGQVSAINLATKQALGWQAKSIVCALPRFVAYRLIPGLTTIAGLVYTPWMTANLTLKRSISQHWDNVIYGSQSLGYVVATHQHLKPFPSKSVITYYQPLDHLSPMEARIEAQQLTHRHCCDRILKELKMAHPQIEADIESIDVWLWGHGMICPTPGFLWGTARASMTDPVGKIHFAHTDMSGLSLFEEACRRGNLAARTILGTPA